MYSVEGLRGMPVLSQAQVYGGIGYLFPDPEEGVIGPRHRPDDIIYVNERLGGEC